MLSAKEAKQLKDYYTEEGRETLASEIDWQIRIKSLQNLNNITFTGGYGETIIEYGIDEELTAKGFSVIVEGNTVIVGW